MVKSVLITGGSGYVGTYLVRYLIENSEMNIRIFDHKIGEKFEKYVESNSERIDFLKGDIRNLNQVRDASFGVDFVVHLAAITSVPESITNPKLTFEVNVEGTQNLLKFCNKHSVSKFVLASSAAVYGENQNLPLSEENAGEFELISPYAESKMINESDLLEINCHEMYKIVLRFFNVYGKNELAELKSNPVTSIFTEAFKCGKTPKIFGDGTSTRDFVHIADVCEAILLSLNSPFDNHEKDVIFNIASGEKTTLLELIEQLNRLMKSRNSNWESITPEFKAHRNGDILHSQASISKVKEILGWEPKITLASGLDEMLD